jgi:hypothetical protein
MTSDPIKSAAIGMIDGLTRRGHEIKGATVVADVRIWQRDCAAAINQLSGGSKAHWLSRAYSSAFLMRGADGGVIVEVSASEIVERILAVLAQARASLTSVDNVTATPDAASHGRRFEFVHNAQLRPILAEAFADGSRALESGDVNGAFVASCSILEAVITDALEKKGLQVSDWSFDARIAVAQREGLIGRGCARLPAAARRYRELATGDEKAPADVISERDARVARQVLVVVLRDLDPGR